MSGPVPDVNPLIDCDCLVWSHSVSINSLNEVLKVDWTIEGLIYPTKVVSESVDTGIDFFIFVDDPNSSIVVDFTDPGMIIDNDVNSVVTFDCKTADAASIDGKVTKSVGKVLFNESNSDWIFDVIFVSVSIAVPVNVLVTDWTVCVRIYSELNIGFGSSNSE